MKTRHDLPQNQPVTAMTHIVKNLQLE